MEFKNEKIALINHYSAVRPFKCEIVDASDSSITLQLIKQYSTMNFLEGDPVVIVIKEGEAVINIGCNVTSINSKSNSITLKIDSIEPGSEMRLHERHPVSLYADVRLKGKDKKYIAVVKDLSHFGIKIYCKESFHINDVLQIDLYLQQKMVFLKGIILRNVSHSYFNEYGLRIEYESYDTLYFVQNFIKNLNYD